MYLSGLPRRRLENFKIQVLIYNNEEEFAKIFLFYFSEICNMFLWYNKVTVRFSYVITEKKLYLSLINCI